MPSTLESFPRQYSMPEVNFLSVDDLLQKPDKLAPYQPFWPITRANFTHFILRSFAESRGKNFIQSAFIFLQQFKTGFSLLTTFREMSTFGSPDTQWHIFSEKEQHALLTAYEALTLPEAINLPIAKHIKKNYVHIPYDKQRLPRVIMMELTKNLRLSLEVHTLAFPISPTMTFEEFQKSRDDYLKNQ